MKRASAPSYDLFKLVVTVVLIFILLLMLLRGCATMPAAPAPTENALLNPPAASDTAAPLPTATESVQAVTETEAAPSNTPESIAPSSTPTVEGTATLIPEEPTATAAPTEPSTTETAASDTATATPAPEQNASCNTIRPSRLSVGDTARVVQRLNMRSDASITAPILQTNPVTTPVEIIGGPVCTPVGERAYLWWQIRLPDGAEGWSAETPLNEATYLLEPAQ